MLSLLRDGVRTTADTRLLARQHALPLLMTFFDSHSASQGAYRGGSNAAAAPASDAASHGASGGGGGGAAAAINATAALKDDHGGGVAAARVRHAILDALARAAAVERSARCVARAAVVATSCVPSAALDGIPRPTRARGSP